MVTVAPDRLHLFILAGQSNMAGRGILSDPPEPDPDILMLTRDSTWAVARDPVHFDKPEGAGVGPGLSFARSLHERHPEWKIGLVPTAVGGSPLAQWQPGAPLFEASMAQARTAAPAGHMAGIIWHQGENDSRFPDQAATYGERLTRTITAFREQLGRPELPFIAGELGPFLADNLEPGFPALPTVTRAISDLPGKVPHTAVVSAAGLKHKGDLVHLDTPSQIIFGQRYAEAFLRLVDQW